MRKSWKHSSKFASEIDSGWVYSSYKFTSIYAYRRFSVWQAHRDQIVGFTGRGVRWITNKDGTGSWKYRQRVTPESISLVLMGSIYDRVSSKVGFLVNA